MAVRRTNSGRSAGSAGTRGPRARRALHSRDTVRRYVVTGGAGFIGSNVVAALLTREPDCHVTIVDDFSSGSYANVLEACERAGVRFSGEVIARSTRDWTMSWTSRADQMRPFALFHLGATTDTTKTDQAAMIENNAGAFWRSMLTTCADAEIRLVYASSAATYGTPPQTARREPFGLSAAGNPNNVYGFSKWAMENAHRAFVRERAQRGQPLPWVVGLRYFNVFGQGESRKGAMASMAYQLAQQILAGRSPRLFEFGEQARDQISVDDVVDCTLAAAGMGPIGSSVTPGIYNLGSGVATTYNQVAQAVREGLGLGKGDREVSYFPMPPAIQSFYQQYTQADMTQTKRGLGWAPRHDPVQALRAYAASLQRAV